MNFSLTAALTAMGYRQLSKLHWAKPFGYSVFYYNTRTSTLSKYIAGTTREVLCWTSTHLDYNSPKTIEELIYDIASFENSTPNNHNFFRSFGFVTPEEAAAIGMLADEAASKTQSVSPGEPS